jgi:hypothetical protein
MTLFIGYLSNAVVQYPRYYAPKIMILVFNEHLEKFEDTKGVIRIRISKKSREHNDQKLEEFEDTKGR